MVADGGEGFGRSIRERLVRQLSSHPFQGAAAIGSGAAWRVASTFDAINVQEKKREGRDRKLPKTHRFVSDQRVRESADCGACCESVSMRRAWPYTSVLSWVTPKHSDSRSAMDLTAGSEPNVNC